MYWRWKNHRSRGLSAIEAFREARGEEEQYQLPVRVLKIVVRFDASVLRRAAMEETAKAHPGELEDLRRAAIIRVHPAFGRPELPGLSLWAPTPSALTEAEPTYALPKLWSSAVVQAMSGWAMNAPNEPDPAG